jgi:hypothetical protein
MKKTKLIFLILIIALLFPTSVFAQEAELVLELDLNRLFGYGGFFGDIQGSFSMTAEAPDEYSLIEVHFYIDDTMIGSATESPFKVRFNTDDFEPGLHELFAVGFLADGTEIESIRYTREFLSGEEGIGRALDFVVPILVVTAVFALLGTVVPALMGKKGKQYSIGEYSAAAGGAVCPRCKMPYSRHAFSPNIVFGKLERCPHCGKWAIVRRATLAELTEAEDRLRADSQEGVKDFTPDEDEALRRALDESQYDD